jgi:hypothetical protein
MLPVVEIGEGFDRAGKSGMGGHVIDAPSRMPYLPSVAQRLNVTRPGSNGHNKKTSRLLVLANI